MIINFFDGFNGFVRSYSFISKHKLWSYVVIPGLISLALGLAIFGTAYASSDDLGAWIIQIYPFEWGKAVMEWLAGSLAFLLIIVAALFVFKYLVMIIVSPFMGTLSEKAESAITGQPAPSVSTGAMISDLIRGIRIALRNLIRELFFVMILTLVGSLFGTMIPVVGGILPGVLIFLIQAYFVGFGNMDYTLERKRFGIQDSVGFVRKHKWMAIGNGTAFTLLLFVPVLGWVLSPALGTVGATMESLKRLDKEL